jgi:hypothetical protein
VSVGAANRFTELGFTVLPPVYDALVGPMMRRFGLSRGRVSPHTGNVFAPAPRTEGGPGRWGRRPIGVLAGVSALAAAAALRRIRR